MASISFALHQFSDLLSLSHCIQHTCFTKMSECQTKAGNQEFKCLKFHMSHDPWSHLNYMSHVIQVSSDIPWNNFQ